MSDETEMRYRCSIKQFSDTGSRSNSALSREMSAKSRDRQPITRRVPSAVTSVSADTTQARRCSSAAVSVATVTRSRGDESARSTRAKTSVGLPKRNDNLSEMFRKLQLIDVKGRPLSAPLSARDETPPLVKRVNSGTDNRGRKLSALKKAYAKDTSPEHQTREVFVNSERKTTSSSAKDAKNLAAKDSEVTKNTDIPDANTDDRNHTERIKLKHANASSFKPGNAKPKTPFWFYRSKADRLIESRYIDEMITDVTCTPQSARSCQRSTSARAEQRSDIAPQTKMPALKTVNESESQTEDEQKRPKSLTPKIYIFDSYRKRFISCKSKADDLNEAEIPQDNSATPRHEKSDTPREENIADEPEVVDLLRERQRESGAARSCDVMRSLPLQSELDKYVWWLETRKHRDGTFTNSMNRFVPGFFHIEEEVPPKKVRARATAARRTIQARVSVVSEPPPTTSTFITESDLNTLSTGNVDSSVHGTNTTVTSSSDVMAARKGLAVDVSA